MAGRSRLHNVDEVRSPLIKEKCYMKDRTLNEKKKVDLCSFTPHSEGFDTTHSKGKLSNGYWRANSLIIEVPRSTV